MTIEPIYLVCWAIGYIGLIWSSFWSHKNAMKHIKQAKDKQALLSHMVDIFVDFSKYGIRLSQELEKERLKVRLLTNPSIQINKACYRYYCFTCNESHFDILDINETFTGKCLNIKRKN